MSDLKTLNLIVGESGSGKTAFLEALFMAGGTSPEIFFRTRGWRGFPDRVEIVGGKSGYESIFRDLFHAFDQEQGILIRFTDSQSGERWLKIYYEESGSFTLPLGKLSSIGSATPISFEWKGGSGQRHLAKVEVTDEGIKTSGFRDIYPIVFISHQTSNPKENAKRFSELSKQMRHQAVVSAVKELFPEIKGISVEVNAGEVMLYASVQDLGERLPLAVFSGGINKYLSVLLAIATTRDGVVLIDEIENGFYYKTMSRILQSIFSFAQANSVQLFATTHSYELQQALLSIVKDNEDDVLLLRAERDGASTRIKRISGQSYRSAIELNLEVR
ncbi:MAG: ATP-binding protein [Acidobacteriia bacterium]|nr:ATP-binding protein [Terriglobia bacterium]